ncbi:UDP-2,3-diacylglucosamine diphosphatase [Acidobacteriota bacterium]
MTQEVEAEAPLAVLADAHFSENTPQKLDEFLAFLSRFPGDFQSLVLLGDLFDFWVGVKGPLLPHQQQVTEKIKEVRRLGAAVYYVEGNRDYSISRIDDGSLFDEVIRREGAFLSGGKRLLMAHGDLVNRADWRYRAWRGLSRGVLAPLALRILPSGLMLKLASRVENGLRGANASQRRGFPSRVCRDYADTSFSRGFDAVIVGHFHYEEEIKMYHEGDLKSFYSVPSWRTSGKVLVVDRDGKLEFF